jgi:penicillin-binding protein-related factor A (putative recombinase)
MEKARELLHNSIMHFEETGREIGDFFEKAVEKWARYCGLLPKKHNLSAKYIGKGRVKVVKSQLDFHFCSQSGQVGFFDCKTYEGDSFAYSQIDPKQLEQAVLYNEWRVPAGFLIWFRKHNIVVFFSGQQINIKGPRSSFVPAEGLKLGSIERLDLKLLFSYANH